MFYRYHPAWRRAQWHMACAAGACDPDAAGSFERERPMRRRRERAWQHFSWSNGPMFGVRRPLRKLSWRLDLDDEQARRLADVLNRLKTAYGQADLDRQRANADIAALFDADAYSDADAAAALDRRARAGRELADELKTAFARMFEVLDADQRGEFARMIRAGEFGF